MSDAIRCEACRWWRQYEEDEGFCEFNPPVFMPGQDPIHSWSWQQPRTDIETGCSRGEPKTAEDGTHYDRR